MFISDYEVPTNSYLEKMDTYFTMILEYNSLKGIRYD